MQSLLQDLRYGWRMILKTPTVTAVAIIALALGIGANTAIYSVVNAVLFRSLPYENADRLVMVWEHNRSRDRRQNVVNPANFMDWKEQSQVFDDMGAFIDRPVVVIGDGEPEEIPAQYATPNLFQLLGTKAMLGRTLTPEDGKPGSPDVVVLSYGLWQRRYGGDPGIIGRRVNLNRAEATVVGVMPPDFRWHIQAGSISGKSAEMWRPYQLTNEMRVRRGRFLTTVAKLKPGVTVEQARAEMDVLSSRLEQQYNDFNANWGINVVSLRDQLTGTICTALLVLFAAVAFLLLIACANVANLLLVRAAARQKEMAVRTALGASRWQIVRQLLCESLILSLLGGIAGIALTWWGLDALVALAPAELLVLPKISLSFPVLAFTLIVSILTALLFGVVPAFESSKANTAESLKEESRSATGSLRSRKLRDVFVITEVALSLLLLIGAGLMIRSFSRLQSVNPGFEANNLLTMSLSLPGRKYTQDAQRLQFYQQAVERLQALPGVESAGAVSFLPFTAAYAGTGIEIEGRPKPPAGQGLTTGVVVTDANYFRTMQISLLRGRLFTAQEAAEMRHVVIINETLAKRHFPNEDPLGKRVTISMKDENLPCEIIGIVADSRHRGLDVAVEPVSYWPHAELVYPGMTLVVRTKGNAADLTGAARNVIHQLDPEQPIAELHTMDTIISKSLAGARFNTLLLMIFAGFALALAAVGIYGVISYSITQRTHEIGVRMALGAQPGDVLKLIVGQGMKLTLTGIVLGLIAAFGLTRLMKTLLYEVSATDPMTFIGIALGLTIVALLACLLPARRAAKTDPMEALRYE